MSLHRFTPALPLAIALAAAGCSDAIVSPQLVDTQSPVVLDAGSFDENSDLSLEEFQEIKREIEAFRLENRVGPE